ncbi:Hypothetical protein IALB_2275 [Ignavibacterium album JCM 16511]|uniref:Uncharacterized protein n=1 Tax=Ignavibacterium album (strain DSM 19864 / JCM 16511 / NBRC 101810 / Mat9-16) TaxID=945713 RepID=I0ALX1_IGNAJ|nr:hypothetical protein [Ignavibacterium album]AFH49978.1 Hypothetical protein IALB_2275 [Ignavibacterium album JCM 16511]
MNKILLVLFFSLSIAAQTNPFKSDFNRKNFADYLFCEQDYLRAAEEYSALGDSFLTDTILYKIAKCYSIIGESANSLNYFFRIAYSSFFYDNAKREIGRIYYLNADDTSLDKLIDKEENSFNELLKLKIALKLSKNQTDELKDELLDYDDDFVTLRKFYLQRKNPDYKSEFLAGLLSTIVPGSGKIYTEEYGDGISAFILTGLFAYLAYDNIKNNHNFRGYLFTGIAGGFYLGNIYGSIASAQIFNAKVDFNFVKELSDFLIKRNYFVREYDFCK